ncbi:fosfomycin resistance glutathione transferase [Citrobacter amalonaticus]|jgi:glutathione S-transferase|nr:fosfomycin resistance glutathione transferase [Citrobacter amalonaticus]EKW2929496.1 fosfomycin resistance glutathione transferase [Citrobacter amalonaticus]HAT3922246.1 fosfomycin resistance glutathione transferase [Citrobacter amalonaticus]HAT3926143.1 fosfomycin resistance glutathione transferase [Citrobacter amalonaticus]
MLNGLNHITLAVSDVARSVDFYVNTLGFTLKAKWAYGAYLSLGSLWLCLSADVVTRRDDYTHYAFSVQDDDFDAFVEKLKLLGVTEWKINKSEGKSFYFLDPDGHKLEIHDGDLTSRLHACMKHPYEGMVFF